MRKITTLFLLLGIIGCTSNTNIKSKDNTNKAIIAKADISKAVSAITSKYAKLDKALVEKGVSHAASLWRSTDGDNKEFIDYCSKNYIATTEEKDIVFGKLSKNFESIYGHFNEMQLEMNEDLQLENGPLHDIDKKFGAFSASSHLTSDLYNNKIAFYVALNFPSYTLEEKNKLGSKWNRKQWAYARLGDIFSTRVPAELKQAYAKVSSDADVYISAYNIYMGYLLNNKGEKLFPKDMILLSHWNLRDEIKSHYSAGKAGIEKQDMVYKVMQRIISQDIPQEVINSDKYEWNPIENKMYKDGKEVAFKPEPNTRYQQIINSFRALKAIDPYCPDLDTYIKRKFSGEMEICIEDVEKLFNSFLSDPVLKEVGKMISQRLARDLKPYDIWYDGFKARSSLDENKLNKMTQKLYPNAKAMEQRLPVLLQKLGWTKQRAKYLADKIAVDPARGSGHAAGAQMKGAKAHLRTRVPKTGMNYKGYNIAVHEFGHNVEQTVSLYDVDHYMLNGVPNTAFTEALAFIFQKRDLMLLDINNNDKQKETMQSLDIFWSTYEIMGVSMVDIAVWKWLYQNPEADAAQLKEAVIRISKEIWNKYFAEVFGSKDETILGIYSHMISYPLYLSAYSFGHIIDFQVEDHLKGKHFATEVDRMYKIGRITPQEWMKEATGNELSVEPMLKTVREIIKNRK